LPNEETPRPSRFPPPAEQGAGTRRALECPTRGPRFAGGHQALSTAPAFTQTRTPAFFRTAPGRTGQFSAAGQSRVRQHLKRSLTSTSRKASASGTCAFHVGGQASFLCRATGSSRPFRPNLRRNGRMRAEDRFRPVGGRPYHRAAARWRHPQMGLASGFLDGRRENTQLPEKLAEGSSPAGSPEVARDCLSQRASGVVYRAGPGSHRRRSRSPFRLRLLEGSSWR